MSKCCRSACSAVFVIGQLRESCSFRTGLISGVLSTKSCHRNKLLLRSIRLQSEWATSHEDKQTLCAEHVVSTNTINNFYIHKHATLPADVIGNVCRDFIVVEDFITTEEEDRLLSELEKTTKQLRYEFEQHWDHAIIGYRETEKREWKNKRNGELINRVKQYVFGNNTKARPLSQVHILDLHKKGFIKPHIDAVRFCGSAVAGLSLMSDAVMRLQREKAESPVIDVLLKRRSLYIMRGIARYDYTHEILPDAESVFGDIRIPRDRRISVMVRSEAEEEVRQ